MLCIPITVTYIELISSNPAVAVLRCLSGIPGMARGAARNWL